jgi:AAA+ ATPase superfamily predicted ATPase
MTNPFRYGGTVDEAHFCNRRRELADILRSAHNAGRMFVYAERRSGKTSLIRLVLARLPRKRFIGIYIDLWPTDGEQGFIAAVAKAMTEGVETGAEKALRAGKSLFSRLTPVVSVDHEGKPVVSFNVRGGTGTASELDEVLAAPARIAGRKKRTVVVVFDEFQRILEYGSDLVERKLRSAIQHHHRVAYVFLGSRKSLLQGMFLDSSRPLYRSATHYPLGPIADADWIPFIRERFTRTGKRVQDDTIRAVLAATEGHPFYTQHLCHTLWDLCDEGRDATAPLLQNAIGILLERERFAYSVLWESLTTSQQRFLRGVAVEPPPVRPFSGDFVRTYQLGAPSTAQRAAAALLQRDIIEKDNQTYIIPDRFFRLWIQRL